MKQAQVQGQVIMYALTLIITALILVYGYKYIVKITNTSKTVELVNFETSLTSDIAKLSSDYGSVKIESYPVPTEVKEVCFYQKKYDPISCPESLPAGTNPLVIDQITDKTGNNVFIVLKDGVEYLDLGKIEVPKNACPLLCITVQSNRLKLRLEGLGDGVLVEEYTTSGSG